MKNAFHPAAVGIALAALTCAVAMYIPERYALDLLAVILVIAATYYAGAALRANAAIVRTETLVGVAFIVVALFGRWFSAPLLAAGYIAHAGWDTLHHLRRAGADAGPFFPAFCLVYDLIVGAFILWRF